MRHSGNHISEAALLKKLGIPDFRHLTKDMVVDLASTLHRLDPEVAKKALEQFPDFANAIASLIAEERSFLDGCVSSNGESMSAHHQACDKILSALESLLIKPDLDFEERRYIIEQMLEVESRLLAKDSENKRFLDVLSTKFGIVIVVACGLAATALGYVAISAESDKAA